MKLEPKSKPEQRFHWNEVFAQHPAFFGKEPSNFAQIALDLFRKEGTRSVLELGCGQGRDTFLFARNLTAISPLGDVVWGSRDDYSCDSCHT